MKIITFATLKGGVGKTMLCFNIAGLLATDGKKVLIIDSDLQGNLTNNIGLDRTAANLPTLYDVYNTGIPSPSPETLVFKRPSKTLPQLDIIPGSIFLHRAEVLLANLKDRETALKSYLDKNTAFFKQYDYILIDTNPSMSLVNQNAFAVSDSIILVSDVSMNAIEGAQLFIALWEESRERLHLTDNIRGFVINDFDSRTRLSMDFLDYIKTADDLDDIRSIALKNIIPRSVRITESELAAIPICLYDKESKAAKAISALVKEMRARGIL